MEDTVLKDLSALRRDVAGVRKDLEILRETSARDFVRLLDQTRTDAALLRESTGLHRQDLVDQISAAREAASSKPDLHMLVQLIWVLANSSIVGGILIIVILRLLSLI